MPERLHERLLHDVVGLLPGAQQKGSPMGGQRVPGDQHGIRVNIAATGPGYRLRVVDGSPYSAEHMHFEYTASSYKVPPRNAAEIARTSPPSRQTRPLSAVVPEVALLHDQPARAKPQQ